MNTSSVIRPILGYLQATQKEMYRPSKLMGVSVIFKDFA